MRLKTNELVKPHVTKNLREIDVFETEHSVDQPRFRIKQHSVALVFLQLLTSLRNLTKKGQHPSIMQPTLKTTLFYHTNVQFNTKRAMKTKRDVVTFRNVN